MSHAVLVVVAVVGALTLSVGPAAATPLAAALLGLCVIAGGLAVPVPAGTSTNPDISM